jgi:hypothetical protein
VDQADNGVVGQEYRRVTAISAVWIVLSAPLRWARDYRQRRKHQPPEAGVRELRRPRPTLPAAAIALAEPRTEVRRWIKLTSRRRTDPR